MVRLNTKTSIVDKLKSEGKDSSRKARAEMYNSAFGGTYTGSAKQNIQLLKGVTSSSSSVRREERDTESRFKRARDDRDNERDSLSEAQRAADRRLERMLRKQLQSQQSDIEASRQSNLATAKASHKGEDATLQSGLVRMGGYLGETASGTAAQISLNQQHTDELVEINNEADRALREAERAYMERDMERMNKNLERLAELEKFAYQKEQDIIANNQKWTQIRNQADQFAQSQSLKWSQLSLQKDKFAFDKNQAKIKSTDNSSDVRRTIDTVDALTYSQNWASDNPLAAEQLGWTEPSQINIKLDKISKAMAAGYKNDEIVDVMLPNGSQASRSSLNNLLKDLRD